MICWQIQSMTLFFLCMHIFPSNDKHFFLCLSAGYDVSVLFCLNWLSGYAVLHAFLLMGAECLEGDTTDGTSQPSSTHPASALCLWKLFLFLLSSGFSMHSNWVSLSVRGMRLPICGVWLTAGLLWRIWRVGVNMWRCVFLSLVISVYLIDLNSYLISFIYEVYPSIKEN